MKNSYKHFGKFVFSLALLLGVFSFSNRGCDSLISASAAVGDSFTIDSKTYDVVYENGFEYLDVCDIDETGNEISYDAGDTGISWTGLTSGVISGGTLSGNRSIKLKANKDTKVPLGYLKSDVASSEAIDAIRFVYQTSAKNINFNVLQSSDGENWTKIETVNEDAKKHTYEKAFDSSISSFYLKIEMSERLSTSTTYLTIDDIQYGVLRKEVSELSLSGTPTKTVYNAGESFDSTGLTVTASFADGSTKDVTNFVSWNPERLTKGLTEVTGSYGGKEVKVTGLTVNKGIDEFNIEGEQLISHTRNGVTYYLSGAGKATIYSCEATVFNFELVYTNTFVIKNKEGKYLQTTSSATISLGDAIEYWEVSVGSIKNGDGTAKGSYDLKGLNNNRYLTLFTSSSIDFRGYASPTQNTRLENTDTVKYADGSTKALIYADYFLKTTDSLCADVDNDNREALKGVWSDLKTKFDDLSSEVQTLIREYDTSNGSGSLKKALERYDPVITRYGTVEASLNNFINRNYSSISLRALDYQNSNMTILIISLSSLIIAGVLIGSVLIIRKRKTN